MKLILPIVEILESTEKSKEAHTQISPKFTTRDTHSLCVFPPVG